MDVNRQKKLAWIDLEFSVCLNKKKHRKICYEIKRLFYHFVYSSELLNEQLVAALSAVPMAKTKGMLYSYMYNLHVYTILLEGFPAFIYIIMDKTSVRKRRK